MAIVSNTNATGRVLDIAATLPLGVSAMTVGLGISYVESSPIDWRTSWWIVPVAHALVAVPFVVRSIVPMLRQIHPSIRAAAVRVISVSGFDERSTSLSLPGSHCCCGFCVRDLVRQLGATSFLPRRADTLTGPQAVFRLQHPGDLLRGQWPCRLFSH